MMNYNPFAHYRKRIRLDVPDDKERSILLLDRIFGATYSMGILDYLLIVPILLKTILIRTLKEYDPVPWRKNLAIGTVRLLLAPFFLIKTGLFLATFPLYLLVWGVKRLIEINIKSPYTKLFNSLLVKPLYADSEPLPLSQINPLCNADMPVYAISYYGFRGVVGLPLVLRKRSYWNSERQWEIVPIKENVLIFHELMKSPELLPFHGNRITTAELKRWIDRHKAPILADIAHKRMHRLLMAKSTDIDSQRNPQHLYDVQKDVRKIIFDMVINSDAQALPQENEEDVVFRINI